jgi:hypothetical protein
MAPTRATRSRFMVMHLLVATPVILGIGIGMAVDDLALITLAEQPTAADVTRAKPFFARDDPRTLKADAVKNVEVGHRALNLLGQSCDQSFRSRSRSGRGTQWFT